MEQRQTLSHYKTMAEMDEEFARLKYSGTDFPEGIFDGRILAISGLSFLLAPLRLPADAIDRINPWRGKSFWGDRGANRWISNARDLHFGHFNVTIGDSPVDGARTLLLDYDVAENPLPLRSILGEARQVPGGYLCRMLYRTGPAAVKILYFSLTK